MTESPMLRGLSRHSLDGVDAALVLLRGLTSVELLGVVHRTYPATSRPIVAALGTSAIGEWPVARSAWRVGLRSSREPAYLVPYPRQRLPRSRSGQTCHEPRRHNPARNGSAGRAIRFAIAIR